MVFRISPQLLRLEEREDYIGVCDCAYSEWLADPTDREKLLTAIMELWLVIDWYEPFHEWFCGYDLNLNISRLQQAAEAALADYSDDCEGMAVLGYCIAVQPFWFIGTSAGKELDSVIALGNKLRKEAVARKPEDPLISALAGVDPSPEQLIRLLDIWDRAWIRDYFFAVLIRQET